MTRDRTLQALTWHLTRCALALTVLALALLAGCGAPDAGSLEQAAVRQNALYGPSDFVTRAGSELRVGSDAFYYAGTNNYYLWYAPIDCDGSSDKCVAEVLEDAQAMDLTVIRTWGFGDGDEGWLHLPAGTGRLRSAHL